MELVEHIDELSQLGRLGLGAQLERLDGTPHYLPGGNPERSRLDIERSTLLRGHQDHQSRGCCHIDSTYMHLDAYHMRACPVRQGRAAGRSLFFADNTLEKQPARLFSAAEILASSDGVRCCRWLFVRCLLAVFRNQNKPSRARHTSSVFRRRYPVIVAI